MIKWDRNYRLTIQSIAEGIDIVIQYPITLQFHIVRNKMASLNTANLVIYNLSRETYKDIFQDRFSYYQGANGKTAYRRIVLEVGYGDDLVEIFRGNLFQARTQRQGSNLVTMIDARDGGFDTSTTKTFQTFSGGGIRGLLQSLIGEMPNLNLGVIGDQPDSVKRPVVIDGNTWDAIRLYSNNSAFIDLETVHVLKGDEVYGPSMESGEVLEISAETGLLGVPRKEDSYILVDTLLEPRILMSQLVSLVTDILPEVFNGIYAVVSVTHQGIISGAVSGECRSSFGLFVSQQFYGNLKNVDPNITRINLDQ